MPVKSLTVIVPSVPPCDQPDTWFESFLGNEILPIVEACPLKRFWFTRYRDARGPFIKFRFEADDLACVEPKIQDLLARFKPTDDGYGDYDYAGDIGEGEQSRFLGKNTRNPNKQRRGDIAFDMLHGAARLTLDCLSGPDANGYFRLEERTDGFSLQVTMEQFHHLFCSVTGPPTCVGEISHPRMLPTPEVVSWEQAKMAGNAKPPLPGEPQWKFDKMRKIVI